MIKKEQGTTTNPLKELEEKLKEEKRINKNTSIKPWNSVHKEQGTTNNPLKELEEKLKEEKRINKSK